jgi:GR25 family glycosyltransferase involved in LPS biosynthesis
MEGDARFRLIRLKACMLKSIQEAKVNDIKFDLDNFIYFQARTMSPQEIGCAVSHNWARKLISESAFGGVILEDDARVKNISKFYFEADSFLRNELGKAAVLSLNQFRLSKDYSFQKIGYQKLFGKPVLAVGYALTPLAARLLEDSNNPVITVSDWPHSDVQFFSVYDETVLHGDDETQSTIDMNGNLKRSGLNIWRTLFQISLLGFFFKRPKSVSFRLYVEEIYISKVTWRIDLLNRRLLRFSKNDS